MSDYLVIGYGSMGRRRVKALTVLEPRARVTVYDPAKELQMDEDYPASAGWKMENSASNSMLDALTRGGFEAAFICSPPDWHLSHLAMAASILPGIPILVEKPICLPNEEPVARHAAVLAGHEEHARARAVEQRPDHEAGRVELALDGAVE